MLEMRENAIMSMKCFLPKVIQSAGYFEHAGLTKKLDIFKAVRVNLEFVAMQDDGVSCGVFCITFLDHIVKGIPLNTINQKNILELQIETTLSLFANNILVNDD